MKKIISFYIIIIIQFCALQLSAQEETKEKIKTGFTFSAVPAIAYDSDVGFKYGGVVNLFHFGDGSTYPKYRHSLFIEWSRTTKGSGINQLLYDSDYLIPNIRTTLEASLFTEQALDFYGFNGYKSLYDVKYEDDEDIDNCISRMYYRIDRKLTRLRTEFQGNIIENKLRWFTNFSYYDVKIDTVNIEKLNEGKDPGDELPDTVSLYKQYVDWRIIPEDQKNGGNSNLFRFGVVYDTRDNEPNPMEGIWTEFQLLFAPSFIGNKDYSFSKYIITHRQYFTLSPKVLNLACRLSYQGKLSGEMPYYMLPFIFNSAPKPDRDGLGGARTVRGVLRDRVVGEDYLYGNIEIRWKFIRKVILNQNIYITLSSFLDGGMVTRAYDIKLSGVPDEYLYLFPDEKETMHFGFGGGIHLVHNENFIVAFDYGVPFNKKDGDRGLYINLGFLF